MKTRTPLRIYLFAGDIAYNIGDEGNFYEHVRLIRGRYPDSNITACTFSPERDFQVQGVRFIKRGTIANLRQLYYMKRAHVCIWSGGAHVTDHGCSTLTLYWLLHVFIIKYLLRTPVIAWGQGVVVTTRLGKFLGKIVYSMVDAICVRDEFSKQQIEAMGIRKEIHLTADIALLRNRVRNRELPKPGQRPKIGLAITFWQFYNSPKFLLPYVLRSRLGLATLDPEKDLDGFLTNIAKLTLHIVNQLDCEIVIYGRYKSDKWRDNEYLQTIIDRAGNHKDITLANYRDDSYSSHIDAMRRFHILIAIPLHEAIFGVTESIPVMYLPYEEKVTELAKRLHATTRMFPLQELQSNSLHRAMAASIQDVLSNYEQIIDAQDEQLRLAQAAAKQNLVVLNDFLAKHEPNLVIKPTNPI